MSTTTPGHGAAVAAWWPWLVLPATSTALVAVGLVLGWVSDSRLTADAEAMINPPLAIGFSVVAAGIWATRPAAVGLRRLGVLYAVVGLGSALVIPAHTWADAAALGLLPGGAAAEWLAGWVWALGAAPLMGLGVLLYPDGLLPGRAWRPAALAGLAAPVLLAIGGPAGAVGFPLLVATAFAGLVALVVRFRRAPASSDVRGQIGSFAVAALLIVLLALLPDRNDPAQLVLTLAAGIALPVTVATAVVRHRLLDVAGLSRRLDTVTASRRTLVTEHEEERLRMRRELHDGLGPSLAAIGLGLRQLETQAQSPDAVRALGDEVQRAVAEVRRICDGLRPAALGELGLEGALRAAVDRLAAPGGPVVEVEVEPIPDLSAAVEVAVFRIAMEATTNALRHASAQIITVTVRGEGGVVLTVADDGAGIAPDSIAGVGLRAMSDRADELGGTLDLTTGPSGTRIQARFPVEVRS